MRNLAITPFLGIGDICPALDGNTGEHYDLTVVGVDRDGHVLVRTDYGHVVPVQGAVYRPPFEYR